MDVVGTFLQIYPNFPNVLQGFFHKLLSLFLSPTESEEYKYLYVPLIGRLILANFQFFQSLLVVLFPNQNFTHFFTLFFDLVNLSYYFLLQYLVIIIIKYLIRTKMNINNILFRWNL